MNSTDATPPKMATHLLCIDIATDTTIHTHTKMELPTIDFVLNYNKLNK